jgi:hypothetical protein
LILLIIDFDQSLNQADRPDGTSRTWLTSTYESHWSTTKSDGMWKFLARLEKKHSKGKAFTILAHKLARAVYDMLKRTTAFDMHTFLQA